MPLYTNNTRTSAIVTLKISAVADLKHAMNIGIPSALALEKTPASLGFHDFLVGPGQVLELNEGTQADFISVRSAS